VVWWSVAPTETTWTAIAGGIVMGLVPYATVVGIVEWFAATRSLRRGARRDDRAPLRGLRVGAKPGVPPTACKPSLMRRAGIWIAQVFAKKTSQ